MGNMILVPGSHNARLPMPVDFRRTGEEFPYREIILGKPGDALVFHQGVFHCTGANEMDFDRYTMHMVYAPPWLAKSDRVQTSPDFMARTTPLRRALMGEWERPEAPFGMGYEAPPFDVA
jgi:ectoine hydroxylase-related dioxygenase (phytanoyl-CoA dioxygenase family)